MQTKLEKVGARLEQLARAPQQLGDTVEALKASAVGNRLNEMDHRAGRLYAHANAAIWFAVCAAILGVGSLSVWMTSGRLEAALLIVMVVLMVGAGWIGVARMRQSRAASAILINELEDRVWPAKWARSALRAISRKGKAQDR